jgi:CBS domain-containing protein
LNLNTETAAAVYLEEPLVVAPDDPVGDVLKLMISRQASCVLICDNKQLLGIFTDRDALRWMARSAEDTSMTQDRPISRCMTGNPVSLRSSASVGKAIRMMSAGRYRHLPVVDSQGATAGQASVRGIIRYLVEHFPDTIYTLPPQTDKV